MKLNTEIEAGTVMVHQMLMSATKRTGRITKVRLLEVRNTQNPNNWLMFNLEHNVQENISPKDIKPYWLQMDDMVEVMRADDSWVSGRVIKFWQNDEGNYGVVVDCAIGGAMTINQLEMKTRLKLIDKKITVFKQNGRI